MPVEVVEPGFLTTIQDLGRWGYVDLGIPVSGAMDPFALMAGNALVGNPLGSAGLEITVRGPVLEFTEGCVIAMTGGDLGPRINGWEIEGWKAHLVRPRSLLEFAGRRSGARAYLAISGGVRVQSWLGSLSTYLTGEAGGLEGRALRTGDRLALGDSKVSLFSMGRSTLPQARRLPYSSEPLVRVILGPHADRFTEAGISSFLDSSYEISFNSNRMGYRLQGPRIAHVKGADASSCGIPCGGIQVPGNGQPIILMADHQITGGYTMIATVIQADIPLVAQCLPGDRLRFRVTDFQEARDSLRWQMESIHLVEEWHQDSPWLG